MPITFPMGKDARRHGRFTYQGPFTLHWTDDRGQAKFATARCFDISESGVRLECPEPLPPRTYVVLRADRIRFTTNASVRYCNRYVGKYIIGFEFSAPSKSIENSVRRDSELVAQ